MSVLSILTNQDDFTGEFPVSDNTVGLWRCNKINTISTSGTDEHSTPDSGAYGRDLYITGSDYALVTSRFSKGIQINASAASSGAGTTYLKMTNSGTAFAPIYSNLVFGGSFVFSEIHSGEASIEAPILAVQNTTSRTYLFRMLLNNGALVTQLHSGYATIYTGTEGFTFVANKEYFIATVVNVANKTVRTLIGDYESGLYHLSPIRTYEGDIDQESVGDLYVGVYTNPTTSAVTYSKMIVDEVFVENKSEYTDYDLLQHFRTGLSADRGNTTCDVWSQPGNVVLLGDESENVVTYPASGYFITRAVAYNLSATGKAAWDCVYISGTTAISDVQTSTSSDLITWSPWVSVNSEGNILSSVAEYIRFKVTMTTTDSTSTPKFTELRVYDIPNRLFEVKGYSYPVVLGTNGAPAAILDHAYDIIVSGEINGEDVLRFAIPYSDAKRSFIQNEARIQIVDDIYKIRTITDEKSSDGKSITSVYAEAEFYDLGFSVYKPVKEFVTETAKNEMGYALDGTGWYVGDVQVSTKRSWLSEKTNALAILRDIADRHGGDLVFDCPRRLVHLYTQYGSDSGALFAYNKNMSQIQKVTNTTSLITRLYAIGAEGITFAEVNDGKPYVEDFSYTTEVRISTLDCTTFTNPTQMLEYARMRLAQYAKPNYSYALSAMDLSLLTGFSHEKWELGDLVTVYDKELNINVKTRVVRREYNLQEPWESKLELSTTLKNLSSSSSSWDAAAAATEGESLVTSVDLHDMVPFNHLRNSRADDAFSHWTNNGFTVDVPGDNSGVSGDACFKCVGISDGVKSLSQTIYPSTRESYTFSGKIAFESIELGSNGGIVLEVEFTYDDGAVETKEFDLY